MDQVAVDIVDGDEGDLVLELPEELLSLLEGPSPS